MYCIVLVAWTDSSSDSNNHLYSSLKRREIDNIKGQSFIMPMIPIRKPKSSRSISKRSPSPPVRLISFMHDDAKMKPDDLPWEKKRCKLKQGFLADLSLTIIVEFDSSKPPQPFLEPRVLEEYKKQEAERTAAGG